MIACTSFGSFILCCWCPRQESNLDFLVRTEEFYPLNYEGRLLLYDITLKEYHFYGIIPIELRAHGIAVTQLHGMEQSRVRVPMGPQFGKLRASTPKRGAPRHPPWL